MSKTSKATSLQTGPILASHSFLEADSSKFISDHHEQCLLEVCPRAFSRPDLNGQDRQAAYKAMYEAAAALNIQDKDYPFGWTQTYVDLVPEPTNKHDPNAIRIILRATKKSPLYQYNGADLGYIPQKISYAVTQHLKRINCVLIKEVYQQVHSKYYLCKIAMGYDWNKLADPNVPTRFLGLLDD